MQASHAMNGEAAPGVGPAVEAGKGGWFGSEAERRSLWRVVVYMVLTRLLFCVVLHYVTKVGAPRVNARSRVDFPAGSLFPVWLRWDTWWYVSIVENGYDFTPGYASNVAFLPGYPALVAIVNTVIRRAPLSALATSNAAFVASVVLLWRWVKDRAGFRAAERSCLLFLLYPLSFFMNAAYAEAPYFLFCLLALRSIDSERWAAAGVYSALATVTRPTGLFLAIAFAWEYRRRLRVGRPPRSGLVAITLPLLALSPFFTYLWLVHGTPLAFFQAQSAGWNVGGTFELFQLPYRKDYDLAVLDVLNFFLPFLLAVFAARAWRRLGPVSGVYSVLASALGILLGGASLGREALAVVPVFAVAGIGERRHSMTALFVTTGLVLLVVFVHAFGMGRFVG